MELVTEAHPDDPVLDVALTHALLRAVAAGQRPDTLRLFRPGPTVAFGKLDRLLPGIGAAWRRRPRRWATHRSCASRAARRRSTTSAAW